MKPRSDHYDDIVKMYPHLSDKKISELTGVKVTTIRQIGVRNGLHKEKYYWKPEEDRYLLANIDREDYPGVAAHLGRSVDAIKNRHRKLLGKRK